ncbi:hypothetical protein GGI42DRAFT_342662 [Trichoderma sp. SZMC 28013]
MKPVSLSFASLAALLSGVSGLARVSERSAPNPNCFPFGSQARLNADLQPPHVSREEWWCPQSDFYGFLGFSFPFQFTNEDFEVTSISSHMQQMKRQFGATMIRMYIPESYTTQLWENVLEAAILNNMGVVVQVAFPISGNDARSQLSWEKVLESTLFETLSNSKYSKIAPYVIYAAEYLNEPVGDCDMCAAGSNGNASAPASLTNLTMGMSNFRKEMNKHGIPAGISEDWDRPYLMSGAPGSDGLGVGLGVVGKALEPVLDFIHAHVMAYYHNIQVDDAWTYTANQVLWYKKYLPQFPLIISEMMWATGYNVLHAGGYITGFAIAEVSVADYTKFWKTVDANCAFLKEHNTAYFIHAWRQQGTLNMLQNDGSVVIPNWKPKKWC